MSLLKCGCVIEIEGGFGDDGLSGRDTIEWCATHRAAEAMADYIRTFAPLGGCVYDLTPGLLPSGFGKRPDDCHCGYCWAQAILATLPPAGPADGGGR